MLGKSLWKELVDQAHSKNMAWLMGGDFSEVLHAGRKLGGNNTSNARFRAFWNCIQSCSRVDLGF